MPRAVATPVPSAVIPVPPLPAGSVPVTCVVRSTCPVSVCAASQSEKTLHQPANYVLLIAPLTTPYITPDGICGRISYAEVSISIKVGHSLTNSGLSAYPHSAIFLNRD